MSDLNEMFDGAGDSEPDTVVPRDDDEASVSDSPELTCIGCKVKSKADCPIAARKRASAGTADDEGAKKRVRVGWGKYTARRVKTNSGRKVKLTRRCGVWCRICMNILKKTLKHKKYTKISKMGLKKGDKHAAVNKVKEEIENGTLADRWKRANTEAIHQHAGGKRRVFSKGALVKKTDSTAVEISQAGKFYLLSKYKEIFADPSITKAKVVRRRWKGKRVRGVVVVCDTDAGVFDHVTRASTGTSTERTRFTGEDALVEEDLDDAESDAMSDMSQEISLPGSSGAHKFSLECAGGLGWNSWAKPPFISRGYPRGLF
jgi:hypothetical protein